MQNVHVADLEPTIITKFREESPPNTRKKPGTWTDQDMSNAVAAVNYGGMSINKAAKVYNVPRNKITERVSKMPPTMNQPMMSNNHSQLQMQYVQPPQPLSVPPVFSITCHPNNCNVSNFVRHNRNN